MCLYEFGTRLSVLINQGIWVVSEPDPRKIERRVWYGLGGSVHCARYAGALPLGF